jgi:hypothetical protein
VEPYGLCAGRLGQLDRCKGDDRHRADSDPGNCNAADASPRRSTGRATGANRAHDRVHIAQPRNRIANRRLLRHASFPEVGHAVLKMVLELAHDPAAL